MLHDQAGFRAGFERDGLEVDGRGRVRDLVGLGLLFGLVARNVRVAVRIALAVIDIGQRIGGVSQLQRIAAFLDGGQFAFGMATPLIMD